MLCVVSVLPSADEYFKNPMKFEYCFFSRCNTARLTEIFLSSTGCSSLSCQSFQDKKNWYIGMHLLRRNSWTPVSAPPGGNKEKLYVEPLCTIIVEKGFATWPFEGSLFQT